MSFVSELQRRNVVRVAIAYLAGAWLLIQVGDTVFPAYGLPDTALTILITVLAIGFVPAVILSWVFEWTPEGMRRDTGEPVASATSANKRLDRIIIFVLLLAVGYFAIDKFILEPARDAALVASAREEGRADARVESYGDRSIAVLPFVNMSADPEQEYFSDGMAEEILNLLSRVDGLRVISRSSAFSFKGKDINIPEVARALNVAHVLEGSVRWSGNTLRITAQLIDARSDRHLWSETYDREFDDVFAIQDEISAAIADQLEITMLADAPTTERTDPQAYALYLHARYLFNTFNRANQVQAKALIDQALTIDPDYQLALILQLRAMITFTEDWQRSRDLHALVARITAVDPDNERANSVQSWVALFVHGDVAAAARFLKRAMSRSSTDTEFLRGTSFICKALGLTSEAMAMRAYVVDRDPTCMQCRYMLAASYRDEGLIEQAETMMQSAVDLLPDDSAFGFALARIQLLNGKPQLALDWATTRNNRHENQAQLIVAKARHGLGQVTEARAILMELAEDAGEEMPIAIAEAFAWVGEKDRAFEYLAKPAVRDGIYGQWHSAFLRPLHDDPRWAALLERYGLAPHQLEALDLDIRLPPGVTIVHR